MPIRRFGQGRGPRKEADVLDEVGNTVQWATSMRETARELRQEQTPAEEMLWRALRRKQLLDLKFYRQVAIDRFIVDFYCPAKNMIVEVDGGIHQDTDQAEHDAIRDAFLRQKGLRILRFTNEDVMGRLAWVLQKIQEEC